MTHKTIRAADLFCGAGGSTRGLYEAAKRLGLDLDVRCVNHWTIAIETHRATHPWATHHCTSLDNVDPADIVPEGELDLLWASPECVHHSVARGGRPKRENQSRASAWHVVRWAEALYIRDIIVENVPELVTWGPLGRNGKPIKRLKGQTFLAWLQALRSLGYNVDYRVLNAANYGDPTTRRRLFVIARRGRSKRIVWPEPTHTPDGAATMFGATERWRTAREIIDWDNPGESIFTRKRPLSENTMRRIFAGLERFGGIPFTVGAGGPQGQARPRSVDKPLKTVLADNRLALVEPFLVELYGTGAARSLDKPLPTVTASGNHHALVQPQPFILDIRGDDGYARGASVDAPCPTVTTMSPLYLVQPFILPNEGFYRGNRPRSVDEPLPTITSRGGGHLVQPFLVEYYGTGQPRSVDEPLPTVTTHDRFALVIPQPDGSAVGVDILFRMLTVDELAAAQGLEHFQFAGNRSEQVRQIGNAVPRRTARALCEAVLAN